MNRKLRHEFNQSVAEDNSVFRYLGHLIGEEIDAPLAKMPVFIPDNFVEQMRDGCDAIIDCIRFDDMAETTKKYVPEGLSIKSPSVHPSFLSIDFAVTRDDGDKFEPRLVELQGFPSVFGFLLSTGDYYHGQMSDELAQSWTFPGVSKYQAFSAFKRTVLGDCQPHEVVLLEYMPEDQRTAFDFKLTRSMLGVETVCLTRVYRVGDQLFYDKDGQPQIIKRVYNRVIFSDLGDKAEQYADMFNQCELEWAGHPDWFYLLSKASLPLIDSPYNPDAEYLDQVDYRQLNLRDYIVKPLFDYAGHGVNLFPTVKALDKIDRKHEYILQKRINYADCIHSPQGKGLLKVEFRCLYAWPDDALEPTPVCILARVSDGQLLSAGANAHSQWTGGTVALPYESFF